MSGPWAVLWSLAVVWVVLATAATVVIIAVAGRQRRNAYADGYTAGRRDGAQLCQGPPDHPGAGQVIVFPYNGREPC